MENTLDPLVTFQCMNHYKYLNVRNVVSLLLGENCSELGELRLSGSTILGDRLLRQKYEFECLYD